MDKKFIRLSKSSIGDAEKNAVVGVLDREYLGMGAEVQKFEDKLSEFFGRPSVCVVNGTAALHLALQACDVGVGDEVLVQSITYVGSFQAISATGAVPVACDVDPNSLTLDWRDAEKRLTSKTKAIMLVHYTGGVGPLSELYAFAHKHGLRVIEDAAHAFGSLYQQKRVGGFGDVVCFSFDGIKNITSGEGGCIVTADPNVLQKVSDARLLGVEKDSDRRYVGERSWEFDVKSQGWRYHMSNIMAAIGIEQLKRFPSFSVKRQNIAKHYDLELVNVNKIKLPNNDYNDVVPHIYPIVLDGTVERKWLQDKLAKSGIQTGIHYQANHEHSYFDRNIMELPVTKRISGNLLSLPLHTDLDKGDVLHVTDTLKKILHEKY